MKGNSSSGSSMADAEPVTRASILRLIKQRDNIDENIQALGQILRSVSTLLIVLKYMYVILNIVESHIANCACYLKSKYTFKIKAL